MKKCKAEVKRGGEEGAKRRISGVEVHERGEGGSAKRRISGVEVHGREEVEEVQRGGYQVWKCIGERRWRRCREEDIRCRSA